MTSRDIKVGAFVLGSLVLIGAIIFMIGDEAQLFARHSPVRAAFKDVAGLSRGSPVRMGGVDIGRVVSLGYGDEAKDDTIYVEMTVVRERPAGADVSSKMADASTWYVRVQEFSKDSPARIKQAFESLAKTGAARYIIDLRGNARGDLDDGLAAARLFVKSGTLAVKQSKSAKESVTAATGDGAITSRIVLLTNPGTSGAAEVFAAALIGNKRAETVGERTLGRTARQKLVKLPDGSGLLLSTIRYQTPDGKDIHEKGVAPEVQVDEPDVEFGSTPPPGDPILDRALKVVAGDVAEKKAA
jgi:carboxyl-terminal processing protease